MQLSPSGSQSPKCSWEACKREVSSEVSLLPASELLDNQLPFHIPAEPVHPEHFAVIEGREVVNVDLPSLGGEKGEVNIYLYKKNKTMWCFIAEAT